MATAAERKAGTSARAGGQVRRVRPRAAWQRLGGLAGRALGYLVLADIAFIFLFPVLYMLSVSLQTVGDLVDPTVYWVPTRPHWDNYRLAWEGLHYPRALLNSTLVATGAAAAQVLSASLVGYGFARFRFPGREPLFFLALFSFLVPPQTLIVPLFLLFQDLGWINTYKPFVVPALFAHGLRGTLFVFIFRQFFRGQPWELEDAARIDGAGALRTYWSIMLPLARPAILVVFLFSLVWHWNDFYQPMIYLLQAERFTLPLRLSTFERGLAEATGGEVASMLNEPLLMAASFLVIVVPLLVYLVAQGHFVQGIERTGLVE